MEVKWIKLDVSLFDNRKIKAIRAMPDGDQMTLIWIMLLTIAGRCNDEGRCYLAQGIYYTPEMLATELGLDEEIISKSIDVFDRLGMITLEDKGFSITNWEKYQSTDRLARIREQTRLRVQRYRERKKEALEEPTETPAKVVRLETPAKKEEPSVAIPDNLDTEAFRETWKKWKGYRKRIKKKLAPETEESQLKKLSKHGEQTAIAMIEQSIGEGWTGLFELKGKWKQQQPQEDYDKELKKLYG